MRAPVSVRKATHSTVCENASETASGGKGRLFLFPHEGLQTSTRLITPAGSARIVDHAPAREVRTVHGVEPGTSVSYTETEVPHLLDK